MYRYMIYVQWKSVYIYIHDNHVNVFHVYVCTHVYSFRNLCIYIYLFQKIMCTYIYNIYIYLYQTHPIQEHHPVKNPSNKNLLHLGDELNLLRIDFGETASGRKGMDSDGKKHWVTWRIIPLRKVSPTSSLSKNGGGERDDPSFSFGLVGYLEDHPRTCKWLVVSNPHL